VPCSITNLIVKTCLYLQQQPIMSLCQTMLHYDSRKLIAMRSCNYKSPPHQGARDVACSSGKVVLGLYEAACEMSLMPISHAIDSRDYARALNFERSFVRVAVLEQDLPTN
jgi:hypothetical protein